jgi:spermidine/putrescine transport system permease protein
VSGCLRLCFVAVPVLWIVFAHIGPLIAMARISFLEVYPGPPGAAPTASLGAYAAFWQEAGFRASLLRSFGLAAVSTFISLILAYPLAYYIALRVTPAQRGRRLMLLVAPFWTSEVLRMFALVLLLSNRGALNALLRWLGLTQAPVLMLYGTGSVLAGMVYTVFLSMLLPLYATLDRLPSQLLDAATILGAGAWNRFWHVTLPLTARGVASGAMLTFLAALGVFTAPALLGGATTPVFATTIADLFGAASGRWPIGAAFGFILLATGTAAAAALVAFPALVTSTPRQSMRL